MDLASLPMLSAQWPYTLPGDFFVGEQRAVAVGEGFP